MTGWDVLETSLSRFDSFWLYLFWLTALGLAYRGFVATLYYLAVMLRGWGPRRDESED